MCRDRASAYAEAVRTVCPDATQVADSYHLWMNLREAVEKRVGEHRKCLAKPADATAEELPEPLEGPRAVKRRERHAAVRALYDQGVPIQVIGQTPGLDRKTVRRYGRVHPYLP